MDLYESTQMDGKMPAEQATRAIRHTLDRIHGHKIIGWHMGMGTQAFSLLTEALASLTGQTVRSQREAYAPTGFDPEPMMDAMEAAAERLCDSTDGSEEQEKGQELRTQLEKFKRANY